ncbi:MAG: glycosyltransferase [Actinobacteria bacterium]|uniref:Unannotated protein n=1 Tax=freshwater metagenome TaxID=449393 RepID=A0A6J7IHV3_9ZZZZ|nr:glycosyltransferase [Actinomycetota bacterium]MSW92508.1 glycosyltransferase [Actinomycetota bacterium]MSX87263.1 glycosyltransferase [Actinomycetota bacterium]
MIPIEGGSFVIAANGYADGPAQPLQRYLVDQGARRVITIAHPLVPEGPTEHRITDARDGRERRTVRDLRLHPPASFALDPFVPLRVPKVDAWFGFNCLATARGLVQRAVRQSAHVVHWNVDFVPERFGPGALTRIYEGIDRWCCTHADGRVDLSQAALEARAARYGLTGSTVPGAVIPMGMWLDRSAKTSLENFGRRRVVFLGHLVERMGVATVVDAVALLAAEGVEVSADIIGGGPLLDETRAAVRRHGLENRVTVHGFIEDYTTIEHMLSQASVALAPYVRNPDSFTRYADPGKLKGYLGASLPIILTDVPPNAQELAGSAGAEIVLDNARDFADAIARLLDDEPEWRRRRAAASAYAERFDWPRVFSSGLAEVGVGA